jgi:hypothetical protein
MIHFTKAWKLAEFIMSRREQAGSTLWGNWLQADRLTTGTENECCHKNIHHQKPDCSRITVHRLQQHGTVAVA